MSKIDIYEDLRCFLNNSESIIFNSTRHLIINDVFNDLIGLIRIDSVNTRSVDCTLESDRIIKFVKSEIEKIGNVTTTLRVDSKTVLYTFEDSSKISMDYDRLSFNLPHNFVLYKNGIEDLLKNKSFAPLYVNDEFFSQIKFDNRDLLNSNKYNKTVFSKYEIDEYELKLILRKVRRFDSLEEYELELYRKFKKIESKLRPLIDFWWWMCNCAILPIGLNNNSIAIIDFRNLELIETPKYSETDGNHFFTHAKNGKLLRKHTIEIKEAVELIIRKMPSNVGIEGVYKVKFQ